MEVRRPPNSLKDVLRRPVLRKKFISFLAGEMALETFKFWEDVEFYKVAIDDRVRIKKFEEIYQAYFSAQSDSEMSITGTVPIDRSFHSF